MDCISKEEYLGDRSFSIYSFFVVAFGFFLTQISTSAFLPVMLLAGKSLQQNESGIQYALSLFFIGYGVGQFLWGSLSDWLGRKRVCCTAFFIYIVAGFCVSVANQSAWFFFMYAMVGFAAASFTSVGNATIRDVYPKHEIPKKVAILGVAMGYK